MEKASLPERAPIGDVYSGLLLQVAAAQVLALAAHPGTHIIASGNFVVRYGLRFLGKLHQSIVPGMVVLDYGDILTGEEAWDFLLKRSNLHPRAEVVGYRSDGSDDMVFIKTLDMAVEPEVLLYADENTHLPLARPAALIATELDHIPARLIKYLPPYSTLAEWQAATQHE